MCELSARTQLIVIFVIASQAKCNHNLLCTAWHLPKKQSLRTFRTVAGQLCLQSFANDNKNRERPLNTSRRDFIRSASLISALAAFPGWAFAKDHAPKPLKLLILGGTGFIGPHEINYALSRGHTVTMFNRGKTAPGLFPDVETLIGDRDDQLDALKGRDWDAVIDNSGFYPRHARLGISRDARDAETRGRRIHGGVRGDG